MIKITRPLRRSLSWEEYDCRVFISEIAWWRRPKQYLMLWWWKLKTRSGHAVKARRYRAMAGLLGEIGPRMMVVLPDQESRDAFNTAVHEEEKKKANERKRDPE